MKKIKFKGTAVKNDMQQMETEMNGSEKHQLDGAQLEKTNNIHTTSKLKAIVNEVVLKVKSITKKDKISNSDNENDDAGDREPKVITQSSILTLLNPKRRRQFLLIVKTNALS